MLNEFKMPHAEEFFVSLDNDPWSTLGDVENVEFDEGRAAISVRFAPDQNHVRYLLVVEIPHPYVARVRFDPRHSSLSDYSDTNSRAIVMDTFSELRSNLEAVRVSHTFVTAGAEIVADEFLVADTSNAPTMKLLIYRKPFRLDVQRRFGDQWLPVVEDAAPSIQFRPIIEWALPGQPAVWEPQTIKHVYKPAAARYVGFGEKAGMDLVKNGKQLAFANLDNWAYGKWYNNGPYEDREPLYNSNPFFFVFSEVRGEPSAYGVFLDHAGPCYIDVGATYVDRLSMGCLYDELDYYLFFGKSTAEIVQTLASFVGHARLKPRYILGYHQGGYGYENREDLLHVVQKYRDYRIPLDGLHIDIDIQKSFRMFTVDESRYGNPAELFRELRNLGVKCSTNITPTIRNEDQGYDVYDEGKQKGMFLREERSTGGKASPPGELYSGGVDYGDHQGTRGAYADLGRKEVREWWGGLYDELFRAGLEMVWQDMTTPCMADAEYTDWKSFPFNLLVTNDANKKYDVKDDERRAVPGRTPAITARSLYAYNLVKATYHGLNALAHRKQFRNFIIARGGFTGMHRFAGLWTGDNVSDWPYLRVNVLQSLAGGISGQPINGADIGGFGKQHDAQGWADPELVIRWTVAGAFLPWFRNHYTRKTSRKGGKDFQEPWAFAEKRNDVPEEHRWLYDCVVPVCRYYIELRYRLLQLFYDAMFENCQTGLPIVRPLFVNEDRDANLIYDKRRFNNDQWFVGRDLLVAPLLDKQGPWNRGGRRAVYLPCGSQWYCFVDNRRRLFDAVQGGQEIDFDAHLSADPDHLGFICPIYVRAGAILPTVEIEQFVGERQQNGKPANPITINIYPTAHDPTIPPVSYDLYEDDGVSRASAVQKAKELGGDPEAKGEYRHTKITHHWTNVTERLIQFTRVHDGYTPEISHFFVAVLHDPKEAKAGTMSSPLRSLSWNGTQLAPITGGNANDRANRLWQSPTSAWYYNEDLAISLVKFFPSQQQESLTLTYL